MGIGDEIMVSGEIKRRARGTMRKFAIVDVRKNNLHRWHDIWWGNPRIVQPGFPFDETYANHGGARPYILEKQVMRWRWAEYTPEPGQIFLREHERDFGVQYKGHVLVNPTIKAGASPNKSWEFRRWQAMIDSAPHVPWLQVGDESDPRLNNVRFVHTPTFRHACSVLSQSRAAVLHEGGLHHAAAAFGVRSVVIYGGFISPRCTGYTLHNNLFVESSAHPLGCGARIGCSHCVAAMEAISPKRVVASLEALLG